MREHYIMHIAWMLANLGVGEADSYTVNVTEMLNNPQIYTAIINGFPYKSASELGVENDYDAFALTKQAVYCILYNRDVRSFYRGGDVRGQKMVDAMERIVNTARNNTQNPNTSTNVNVNKVGEFVQDSKEGYYSQTYSVSADAEIRDYTVSISNIYEGTLITDINGNIKNTFTGGEQFKILVPTKRIIDNKNISINVSASIKNYPIFYGKAPNSDLQDYALTYSAYSTGAGQQNLDVNAYKSGITVVKIDAETKKPLEGVEFNFKYANAENIGNYKTDKNGKIVVTGLRQGTVIATEVSTLQEYILNTEEQEVVLGYDDNQTLNVENEHKRGNVKVYKVDADNHKIVLGGVRFALYSYEFEKVTGYYTTDANGEIFIENLRTGKWALIEEETNKWYNLADSVDIKVEWNETTDTIIENELRKSQVKIVKVDQENHEIKLQDVELEVLDKDGNVLEKLKTDKNGECFTKRYAVRDYPELYIREIKTNEKYVLDTEMKKIVLQENEIVNYTFENRKIKGQIEIIKTSEEDSKITGTKAGEPMANVSFDIYDENKNYIETIKTAEDGTAITSLLEKGIYYVKEKDSPEWYLLNTNEYSAEIVNDGDIITVEITNVPETPEVDVEKDGIIQTTANEEIKYDFTIANTGNTKLDKFTWFDYLPTDYVVATKLVTGTYNQDLDYNVYYKTNLNDYKLLAENLNTQENHYIDFSTLDLAENEYVTEFKLDFGTVDVGFASVEKPELFVKVKSDVKNDDTFTNKTRLEGYNKTYLTWDEDDHTTTVYEKEIKVKLPKTGF